MIPLSVGGGDRRRSPKDTSFDIIRLLYVGRVVKAKGLTDLIRAAGKLKEASPRFKLRLDGEQKLSYPDFVTALQAPVDELDLADEITFVDGVSARGRVR